MSKTLANKLTLRTPSEINLANALLTAELKVVLVTSANPQCGTTTSALALASELRHASHEQVLLIDASLASNHLTGQTRLTEHPGFLDLTAGPSDSVPEWPACILEPPDLPCHFMPLGGGQYREHPPSPDRLQELFNCLRSHYRFVVIDGSAIYAPGGTLAISTLADGVVLVLRAEETRWEVAQAAIQRLNLADAKLIGSVFNARRYYVPKWVYDLL